MAVEFHLKQFDGPLDLLLHLVDKAKIEPKDIFVSEITEQYIRIVQESPSFDMDEASEFIQMAALLVEIKSRRLLPKPPREEAQEEDPEQLLIQRLVEYKQFKETASNMASFEHSALAVFGKLPEEMPPQEPTIELDGLTLEGLWNALMNLSQRKPKEVREVIPFRVRDIRRDLFSVDACIETIENRLRKGCTEFSRLFSDYPTREEAVTLFIALLEVLKQGKAHVVQDSAFGRILLYPGSKKNELKEDIHGTDESAAGD